MSARPQQQRFSSSLLVAVVAWGAAATMARADARAEAKEIFDARCAPCHGAAGAGDGAAAAALIPRPSDLRDASWQRSTTDQAIARIIVHGGPAVGKSPLMPPNPDLVGQPVVVAELVALLRSFGPLLGGAGVPAVTSGADQAAAAHGGEAPVAAASSEPPSDGEALFRGACAACHTVGAGKLVGPDLAGVNEKRPAEWLRRFVQSSTSMIESGDPQAVELFAEYGNVLMPDSTYTPEQVDTVLAWIAELSRSGQTFSLVPVAPSRAATAEDIRLGQELFQGRVRFQEKGPACNSCHHVENDAVIGGGVLAKELTTVFTAMGAPGVRAILGQPPFPVMEQAYASSPLTDDEIFALVAFLEDADARHAFQEPRDYGLRLFLSGSVGLVVLLAIYSLAWGRRKKLSVNHAIHARQVRSH